MDCNYYKRVAEVMTVSIVFDCGFSFILEAASAYKFIDHMPSILPLLLYILVDTKIISSRICVAFRFNQSQSFFVFRSIN